MKACTSNRALDLVASLCDEIYQREESVVMATIVDAVGSNPQQIGARMIVFFDGEIRGTVGGGRIEANILQDAKAMFAASETTALRKYNLQEIGMTCGGAMQVFFERIDAAPHLILFGGGHVAAPTAHFAAEVGFRVTVIDERTEWANAERFPQAEIIHCSFPAFLSTYQPRLHHYIVLVSQGHAHDVVILEHVINGSQRYIGMIGSKQKARSMWKHLQKKGISEAAWQRVHCPIGIDIKGRQPEEIAISIVAQLIQIRHTPLCEDVHSFEASTKAKDGIIHEPNREPMAAK